MSHTKAIDLGRDMREPAGLVRGPMDVMYPELHISDIDDERLLGLPDEGTAEIRFKITHRTHHEDNNGEKKKRHTCSITMEIRSLEPGHDPKFNGKKAKTHWEMFNGG
jgi:hypothetical protein